MDAQIKMSTRFMTEQDEHQVRMLVHLEGDAPPERPPINLALVLDRSGSMAGEPLEEAKTAALRFTQFLGVHDRLTVVAFDDHVQTLFGPGVPTDPHIESAIRALRPGNTTNLSGGWLKGREHVSSGLVDGTNRVVLLTDGCANQGITDSDKLSGLARGAGKNKISTTCVGFGAHFNEDLLREMSDAGQGNYWYIETVDQMGSIFDEEIEGLVALVAQNVEIGIQLTDPRVAGVSFVQDLPISRSADGSYSVRMTDLYATTPRLLGVILHVENVSELGKVELGEVRIAADVLVSDGVEHRVTTLPIVANLDREDHIEPHVEATLVRFEAAEARQQAVRKADRGDLEGAAELLRTALDSMKDLADSSELDDEREDLQAEADRMSAGEYTPADRKYHIARSVGSYRSDIAYLDKLSRRKKEKDKPSKRNDPDSDSGAEDPDETD